MIIPYIRSGKDYENDLIITSVVIKNIEKIYILMDAFIVFFLSLTGFLYIYEFWLFLIIFVNSMIIIERRLMFIHHLIMRLKAQWHNVKTWLLILIFVKRKKYDYLLAGLDKYRFDYSAREHMITRMLTNKTETAVIMEL